MQLLCARLFRLLVPWEVELWAQVSAEIMVLNLSETLEQLRNCLVARFENTIRAEACTREIHRQ
jgi:hypothetical protein